MSEATFDLVEIIRIITKRFRFTVIFTVACIIVGAIVSFMSPKKFTAKSSFIVKGPMLMDRNHIFNRDMYQNIIMFASEDDIDNVVAMSNSDTLLFYLVDKYQLQNVYEVGSRSEAMEKLRKDFDFKRNDTKNLEVKFTSKTPELAANLTNSAVDKLNEFYGTYFAGGNKDIINFIEKRLNLLSDTISELDDTIASLRAKYGIYDKLLPSRALKGNNLQAASGPVSTEAAAGLEKLQEIAILKDHLAEEQAEYHTLINEYELKAGHDGVNMLHIIQRAYTPSGPSWPILWIICGVCAIGGFFFACILVIISAFYTTRVRTSTN